MVDSHSSEAGDTPNDEEPSPGPAAPELHLLADDPVASAAEDTLDRAIFGATAASLVRYVSKQTDSAVLGLIGPWGGGKTSVLNFCAEDLRPEWRVVSYNPWALMGVDSALAEFFSALAEVLPAPSGTQQIRRNLARYAAAVSPFLKVIPGVDISGAFEGLSSILKDDTSLDRRRSQLAGDLTGLSRPVLVMIDDIDRLHPDELLLVFKLVRLIGRLPNIYYLLAFDESSVLNVLCGSAVAHDRKQAQRFVEKIVQIRIDLPPLHEDDVDRLLTAGLDHILSATRLEVDEREFHRFAAVYQEHIKPYLSEPRTVKRYLGQVEAYWPLVAGEANFIDFLVLTFVRSTFPDLFRRLPGLKPELVGGGFALLDRKRNHTETAELWKERLRAWTSDEDADHLFVLFAELFTPIGEARERVTYADSRSEAMYAERRVGSIDYFDRYFQFGVPRSDVSDRLVAKVIEEVQAGSFGVAVAELEDLAASQGDRVMSKLIAQSRDLPPKDISVLIELLARLYPLLPTTMADPFREMFASKYRAALLAADLLRKADAEAIPVELITASKEGLAFLLEATLRATHEENAAEGDVGPPLVELKEKVIAIVYKTAESALGQEPADGAEIVELLIEVALADEASETRDWLRGRLSASSWEAGAIAALCVSIMTSYGGGRPRKTLGELSLRRYDAILGLDQTDQYFPKLEDLDVPRTLDQMDTSFDNRKTKALIDLKKWLSRRDSTSAVNPNPEGDPPATEESDQAAEGSP